MIISIFINEMPEKIQPNILVTNDDGIASQNLFALAEALSPLGRVFVVAPDTEKSGVSHAFTHREGLSCRPVLGNDFAVYAVSGTPADCVKFAVSELLKETPIDVVFSGVNAGENAGISSIYSGTVAGAREATLWGIPAISLSLVSPSEFMLSKIVSFAKEIVQNRWYLNMSPHTFWNVNFPDASPSTFGGVRATTMGLGMFSDDYEHRDGLWFLDGCKPWSNALEGSDDEALFQSFAALTPLSLNSTDRLELNRVQALLASAAQ